MGFSTDPKAEEEKVSQMKRRWKLKIDEKKYPVIFTSKNNAGDSTVRIVTFLFTDIGLVFRKSLGFDIF